MRGSIRWAGFFLVSVALFRILSGRSGSGRAGRSDGGPDLEKKARIESLLGNLPLYFVENRGQEDPRVIYSLPGRDAAVYFTRGGITFALTKPSSRESRQGFARASARGSGPVSRERWAIRLEFLGANPDAVPRGQNPAAATVSYFKGPASRWKTRVPTYASVLYADLWPGIDLVYGGVTGHLKYTFFVKPGADPGRIRLAYRGASGVTINGEGQLEVSTPACGFADDRPFAYQEAGGRQTEISMAYRLDGAPGEYGFRLGAYDASRTLVLDPSFLVYSGYIGGSSIDGDFIRGIDVDSAGNLYVAGEAHSGLPSFPATVGPDVTLNDSGYPGDAFVAKVKADGTGLVYAGFIGGADRDSATSIAVDSAGNAYVAGETSSDETTFPVLVGPGTTHSPGHTDAFVAKVRADGTGLIYCGYIGGAGFDSARGIAVNSSGNAVVVGITLSDETTFPVLVGPSTTHHGGQDVFVAKIKTDGSGFVWSGYIGGAGNENAYGIALDSAANAYIAGQTDSDQSTFPVKTGPDLTFNGGFDGFVAKIRADGTGLIYAGYIGGSSTERASAVAVDSAGSAYVVGSTSSDQSSFPVAVGPDLTRNGGSDGFIVKVKPDGSGFVYGGYIGGAQGADIKAVAVDQAGCAYVAGETFSDETSFPVRVGPGLHYQINGDGFVAKVKADGSGLLYAGYIGGTIYDTPTSIAVDSAGNAYVAGFTASDESTFPVTVGPDVTFNGGRDNGFVTKVSGKPDLADSFLQIPGVARRGASFAVTSRAFNLALGTAPASTTRYYLSADIVKSGDDILLAGSKAVAAGLIPGAFVEGGATVTIPNSAPLGSYYVLACADDPGAVAEIDETNNCNPSPARIGVTLPDLRITGQSGPPASANPGNRITVSDAVRNFGAVDAAASTTRYYFSTDTAKSANDIRLTGSRSVPALAPAADSGFSVSVTIPTSTPLGSYHILACADDLTAVAETDETNNCRATTGTTSLTSPAFDKFIPLKPSGRVATVTVLATCTDGAEIHVTVSIEQGEAFGQGKMAGKCTGEPGRYPVTVSAEGPDRFGAGSAVINAEAAVKLQGDVLDDHFWTRTLTLSPP